MSLFHPVGIPILKRSSLHFRDLVWLATFPHGNVIARDFSETNHAPTITKNDAATLVPSTLGGIGRKYVPDDSLEITPTTMTPANLSVAGGVTASFWVMIGPQADWDNFGQLFSRRNDSSEQDFAVGQEQTSDEFKLWIHADRGAHFTNSSIDSYDDGEWHNLVFTCDASNGWFYADGDLVETVAMAGGTAWETNAMTMLRLNQGRGVNPEASATYLNFALYNRNFTALEVKSLYDPLTRWDIYEEPNLVRMLLRSEAAVTTVTSTGVQTLPSLSQVGSGVEKFTSTGVQTLPSIDQAGVGVMQPSGTSVQTLPVLTEVGTGVQIFTSTGVQVLPSLTQAGVGVMLPSGTGVQVLPSLAQAGVGVLIFTSTGVQTLPVLIQSGVGVMQPSGTGVQTLASLIQTGSGLEEFIGTGIQTLSSLIQTGIGVLQFSSTGVQILPTLLQTGSGIEEFIGTGVLILPALIQTGTGVHTILVTSTGAQILPSLIQTGTGTIATVSGGWWPMKRRGR